MIYIFHYFSTDIRIRVPTLHVSIPLIIPSFSFSVKFLVENILWLMYNVYTQSKAKDIRLRANRRRFPDVFDLVSFIVIFRKH